jgi:heme/copper-type cytochrome/quinol oxidase subunit 2
MPGLKDHSQSKEKEGPQKGGKLSNMQTKYTKAYGTPMVLPKEYSDSIELFKRLTITTFCICTLILLILYYRIAFININFTEELKNASYYTLYDNGTAILTLLLSAGTIIISSIQISTANNYSKLTRQQLIV